MKNVLLILVMIIISPIAYGYDDFFITSDNPITKIENKTPDIISVKEVTTLMNERNIIIISIKKEGCGIFNLTSNEKQSEIKITIKDNKVNISTSDYNYYTLDKAPGVFELDPPPINIKKGKEVKPSGEITSLEHIGEEE